MSDGPVMGDTGSDVAPPRVSSLEALVSAETARLHRDARRTLAFGLPAVLVCALLAMLAAQQLRHPGLVAETVARWVDPSQLRAQALRDAAKRAPRAAKDLDRELSRVPGLLPGYLQTSTVAWAEDAAGAVLPELQILASRLAAEHPEAFAAAVEQAAADPARAAALLTPHVASVLRPTFDAVPCLALDGLMAASGLVHTHLEARDLTPEQALVGQLLRVLAGVVGP